MPLEDINQATFEREAARVLKGEDCKAAIAKFAKLGSASERLHAFRALRGGSVTSAPSTKLGQAPHTA